MEFSNIIKAYKITKAKLSMFSDFVCSTYEFDINGEQIENENVLFSMVTVIMKSNLPKTTEALKLLWFDNFCEKFCLSFTKLQMLIYQRL